MAMIQIRCKGCGLTSDTFLSDVVDHVRCCDGCGVPCESALVVTVQAPGDMSRCEEVRLDLCPACEGNAVEIARETARRKNADFPKAILVEATR